MKPSFQRLSQIALVCGSIGWSSSSPASGVATYTDLAGFQAVSTTTLRATFESLPNGSLGSFSDGGVSFIPCQDARRSPILNQIIAPGSPEDLCCVLPHVPSNGLASIGDECFDMIPPQTTTAFGFNVITNDGTCRVSLFDAAEDQLLATYNISGGQDPNTQGFVGVTSETPIGRIYFQATNPTGQNVVIDDLRTGLAITPTSVRNSRWGRVKSLYR